MQKECEKRIMAALKLSAMLSRYTETRGIKAKSAEQFEAWVRQWFRFPRPFNYSLSDGMDIYSSIMGIWTSGACNGQRAESKIKEANGKIPFEKCIRDLARKDGYVG